MSHRCIGDGANVILARTPDADVLKEIVIKLQKRVTVRAATLLVKVKPREDPPNEEADIRAEMGRLKELYRGPRRNHMGRSHRKNRLQLNRNVQHSRRRENH